MNMVSVILLKSYTFWAVVVFFVFLCRGAHAQVVKQWGLFERTLTSQGNYTAAQKYSAVRLDATFSGPNGATATVPGFWDGGNTWRIRFSPPLAGAWTYTISSSDPQLGSMGNNGSFVAEAPSAVDIASNPNYRGALRVSADRRRLTYADGTPFFWMGDTLWDGNSVNMSFEEFQIYVANRRSKGFNLVQILVAEPHPLEGHNNRSTGYNSAGPIFLDAWTEINPANLQEFDRRIAHLAANGMVACIFLNWGEAFNALSAEEIRAYHRYLVARYQGWNVIWTVSGEYGQARDLNRVRQAGQYVHNVDGLGRLTTAHPGPNTQSRGFSSTENFTGERWLDFHMQHTWTRGEELDWMTRAYQLDDGPVVNAEAGYDGLWSHDRARVRREAWAVIIGGGAGYTYGALGVSYPWNDGCCDDEAGGSPRWPNVIDLPSSFDMARMAGFFRSIPWATLSPRHDLVSNGMALADNDRTYVVYLPQGGATQIRGLPENRLAEWFNPRDGSTRPAKAGESFRAPDGNDWVLFVDADTSTRLSVVDPGSWNWYVQSGRGRVTQRQFGFAGVIPVPMDYDGDGFDNTAVYSPDGGRWYILERDETMREESWGWDGAVPVPGDYNGDGRADPAVFDRAAGDWYLLPEGERINWGYPGTMPVPADYDGDGVTDLAVFHIQQARWDVLTSGNGGHITLQWGWAGVVPVAADFDGDGRADVAVFDPGSGDWHIIFSRTGEALHQNWGWNRTLPVPGDYDGDGRADLAVFNRDNGDWYVLESSSGNMLRGGAINWGGPWAQPTDARYWTARQFGLLP